jgi:hypothetical protein
MCQGGEREREREREREGERERGIARPQMAIQCDLLAGSYGRCSDRSNMECCLPDPHITVYYFACLIPQTDGVYCAVRTVGRAVSPRLRTAEAGVRSQVSPYEVCSGQVALGQVFVLYQYFGLFPAVPRLTASYYCFYRKDNLANPDICPTNRCDL